MRIKKTIAIALSLALGASLLTGCSKDLAAVGDNNNPDDNETPGISQDNGEYTITFDANGGTFGTNSTFTATTTNGKLSVGSMPQNPTYSGYTFDVWQDASGKIFSLATTYTANVTYKAQWIGSGSGDNNSDNTDDNNNNNGNDDNNNNNDNNQGNGDDNNNGNDNPIDGDDNPISDVVTFVFSTGWDEAVKDVRIHIWGDEAYTNWTEGEEISGDSMTDNGDGTFSYTVTVDYRGDVQGLVVMFTQKGKSWYAKSTDCTSVFMAGGTYNIKFSDWNNDVYGAINWDTWGIIPFDIVVS